MKITRQAVAERLAAYLRRRITLDELVDWAEDALMKDEFDQNDAEVIAAVVARIGVADVRAFGLTWEDCEDLLRQLGYSARIDIVTS
jgi:cobyrinic acid a,c-diamide synthase